MPSIDLPYVNIALNTFALLVVAIIFATCVSEYSQKKLTAHYFLLFQISVIVALIAEIISWFSEGQPSMAVLTIVTNTIVACSLRIAIGGFMGYLVCTLYSSSKVAKTVFIILNVFCVLSVLFSVGNALYGYAFYVDETGHYVHSGNNTMGLVYLLYPIIASVTILLMSFLAKSTASINRAAFVVYTVFPIAGVVVDYLFHGLSFRGVGFAISILVIYTSIYTTRRRELESQKNALMLSQINPHFIYNALSTIAAMCDVAPSKAKHLTIDFAQYLRGNINSLSSDEQIPFERELEHVECYLKIEKARFGERLNVIYSIQCRNFNLPPLTLQPIVENAVKHGITKKMDGGTIKICTYESESYYVIDIIDDGVGFDVENAEMHVGVQNVRNRIASMCHGDVTIKSTGNVGTRVTIEIPKKKGNKR